MKKLFIIAAIAATLTACVGNTKLVTTSSGRIGYIHDNPELLKP